ncbi:protein NOI4 isoform X1 [Capsicum chacoense]
MPIRHNKKAQNLASRRLTIKKPWPLGVLHVFFDPSTAFFLQEKGQPLPKFGEWDVNDPASAEGFTVIFNKARNEKKTGGNPESPTKADSNIKQAADTFKPQAKKWFCCMQSPHAES